MIYIRMYVLLTVWVLTLFNLHVKWITEDKIQSRDWLILILIAYLGYMSHYYFFVIAFFTAAFYFFYLLWTGKRKTLIKILCYDVYQFTVGGIDISSGLYKAVFGQRGNEAVHNLFNLSDILGNAKTILVYYRRTVICKFSKYIRNSDYGMWSVYVNQLGEKKNW